jgi:hypothetical protein
MPHGSRLTSELRLVARRRIVDGRLPMRFSMVLKGVYGPAARCDVCERSIEQWHLRFEERDVRDGAWLLFHLTCHAAWQLECLEQWPPPIALKNARRRGHRPLAATIVVAQTTMIVAALLAMRMGERQEYWLVLLISFTALPVRALTAAVLIKGWGMFPVQILDGIGAGLQSVAVPARGADPKRHRTYQRRARCAHELSGPGRIVESHTRRLAGSVERLSERVSDPGRARARLSGSLDRIRIARKIRVRAGAARALHPWLGCAPGADRRDFESDGKRHTIDGLYGN